jgi:hypothetical protein
LPDRLLALEDLLARDLRAGAERLFRLKQEARDELPEELRRKARGKVVVVTMGRRVSQKLHEVFVESVRQLLGEPPGLPLLAIFATTHGDAGSGARLARIRGLADAFPENVAWSDGRLPYYRALMNAVDYNCMCSLMEPHGGAFCGTVVPLARAIDGLAAQICAFRPTGPAAPLNALWHPPGEPACGLTFREEAPAGPQTERDLAELLTLSPAPANPTFVRMQGELSAALRLAVDVRQKQPDVYARLVLAALRKQRAHSWEQVLGQVRTLVDAARTRRRLAGDDAGRPGPFATSVRRE